MENSEKMTGLWFTLFSNVSAGNQKNSEDYWANSDPIGIMDRVTSLFNDSLADIAAELIGQFDDTKVELKAVDENNPQGSSYISFPDFVLDFSDLDRLFDIYSIKKESINRGAVEELARSIDKVRIGINPCLFQNHKKKRNAHKTKIYVNAWHSGDYDKDLCDFFTIGSIIAKKIAGVIYKYYKKFVHDSSDLLVENNINSCIITGVSYNSALEKIYSDITQNIHGTHSVKRESIEELWKPFYTFRKKIIHDSGNSKKPETFLHETLFKNKKISGIYGISGGLGQDDENVTCIFGVAPYPKYTTLGVHKPIIMQQ